MTLIIAKVYTGKPLNRKIKTKPTLINNSAVYSLLNPPQAIYSYPLVKYFISRIVLFLILARDIVKQYFNVFIEVGQKNPFFLTSDTE